MGHYSRECPNSPVLATRENASSSTRRFFAEEKGKAQVHLIEPISEGRENALMGLEKSLQFPEDAMDVMAQVKRPMEDTTHPDVSIKRFKEMARARKIRKRIEGGGLAFKTFQFLDILALIQW
jgi:hypothetical protein